MRGIPKSIGTLSITGGEPTLRKDLVFIINMASKIHSIRQINLQTNATLVSYKEYTVKLKKAGLDTAFVAFHSHKESVSNKLTSSTFWDKTVQGIKNLLSIGIPITLNPVINKLNYHLLPQYVKFVKEEFPNIKCISLSFVQPVGRAWKNKWIIPRYSEVLPYLKKEVLVLCVMKKM